VLCRQFGNHIVHRGHLDSPALLLGSPLVTLSAAKAGHRGFRLEYLSAAFTNSIDNEIRTHIMIYMPGTTSTNQQHTDNQKENDEWGDHGADNHRR
jgi:hypothetical protein